MTRLSLHEESVKVTRVTIANRTWKQLEFAVLRAQAHGYLLVPASVDDHHLEEERLREKRLLLSNARSEIIPS